MHLHCAVNLGLLSALCRTCINLSKTIGFVSLTEGIDTTSSSGKLVFHVFGALAEFEREMIRERTKAGLQAAKSRGRRLGRPAALSPDQIEMARALKKAGNHSMPQIAKQLGVSRATLYRVLGESNQSAWPVK